MTMETHIIYLALGSNLGDRLDNLRSAVTALSPQLEVKAKSHIYETPPWGYEDQPRFYNQVIKADTYLQPEPLLRHLKRLEVALGRQPNFQNGPRLIDLDLLLYDQLVLDTPALTLPHPRLHERGFVLLPLMDLAPEYIHPVLKKSVRELTSACSLEGIIQVQ